MSALTQKITGYDLWHLALPVVSVRDHGIGRVAGACEIVVLRLTAEDGTTGYGEASPWAVFTGTPEAAFAALDRYIRPFVLGQSVGDRAIIVENASRAVAFCTDAKAALETALLDLEGRILGRSVADLMGGAQQATIPLSVSLANPDFDADRALLDRLVADGVGMVKLKTGFNGLDFDVMRLKALAKDYPSLRVRVDYNQGLRGDDALEQVKAVAALGPDFIEQPVPSHAFDKMAQIRAAIDVPLLADESVFGPEDLKRAIAEGICDGVSIKIMKAGGLTRAQATAQNAVAAGLVAYGGGHV